MRKFGWLAAAVLACAPVISNADFIINHTRTEGTGSMSGFHIYKFYAKNTQSGMHPNSTTLAGIDFRVTSLGDPFKLDLIDFTGEGRIDVNLNGIDQDFDAPTGTFMRIGPSGAASLLVTVPNTAKLESSATYNAVTYYSGRTDFRLAMANLPGSRPNATTGQGAGFAVVIVPTGSGVRLVGQIADEEGVGFGDTAADQGDSLDSPDVFGTTGYFQIPEYIAQTPEPGSIALLAIAAVGLCRRSRRANR